MKEINISNCLIKERQKKGIRQEQLAEYIGVSKAAVSKWENNQSYPDITLLPKLASYFDISIDKLIGYEPQMMKEDIRKLYHELASDFALKPFNKVMNTCENIIKKYYSCFPLLNQMAVLLLNHSNLSDDPRYMLQKAADLANRVKMNSKDINEVKKANLSEATSYLMMQEPNKALDLLDETIQPILPELGLLSQIYQSLGNTDKAKEISQIGIYQQLLFLVNDSVSYMMLYADNVEKSEEIMNRTLHVAQIYKLKYLHPNTMASLYITCAQIYCMHQEIKKALGMLKNYADLCTSFFPCNLHGDDYFDLIDPWFQEFDIGNKAPRNENNIKVLLIQAVTDNPYFSVLADNKEFKHILKTIKNNLGVE